MRTSPLNDLPPGTSTTATAVLIPFPINPTSTSVLEVKERKPVRRTIWIKSGGARAAERLELYLSNAQALDSKAKDSTADEQAIKALDSTVKAPNVALAPNPKYANIPVRAQALEKLPELTSRGCRNLFSLEQLQGAIASGAKTVKIHGSHVPIQAEVIQFDFLSAHADRDDLLRWAGACQAPPKHVFVTHGEALPADRLRHEIEEGLHFRASVPDYRDQVELQ